MVGGKDQDIPLPFVLSWTFHCMRMAPAVPPFTVHNMSEISTTPESPMLPTLQAVSVSQLKWLKMASLTE